MPITATSHAFAAGDIDYINNLNLVRTDIGSLITDANTNPKGTMAAQNANAVAITGGSAVGLSSVGIGTASPQQKLEVVGGLNIGFGSSTALPSSVGDTLTIINSTPNKKIYFGDGSGYSLDFSRRVGGVSTDLISFKDSGSIGVGVTTPLQKIDVLGGFNISYGTSTALPASVGDNLMVVNSTANKKVLFGDGSGFSLDFSKRSSSTTTDLVSFKDNGTVLIGTTDNGSDKLQVNGGVASAGRVVSTSATAGVGYATGAGGSVTQATSISTAVTLNTVCGKIALFNHTFTAGTKVQFTLNNTSIGTDDVLIVNGSSGPLRILAHAIGNGANSRVIVLDPMDSGATPTNYVTFAVIKAVTS